MSRLRARGLNMPRRSNRIVLPSGFLPTQLAGCMLWLRADKGITLNGSTVSAWNDQVGGDANKNCTQSTPAQQPTWNASSANFNNQSSLTYNGATAGMSLVSGTWASALPQPITVFAVSRHVADANNDYLFDSILAGTQMAMFDTNSSNQSYFAGISAQGNNTNTDGTTVVWCFEFNGASSKSYKSAITAFGTGNPGTNGITGTTIGCFAGLSTFAWSGEVAEYVYYNSILSLSDRTNVMNYLGARYGVTIGA